MKDQLNPEQLRKAQTLALDIGDKLYDSGESPEIQMNTSAIVHASICYAYGLDMHTTIEVVMHMYKQMEKKMGKV